MLAYRLLDVLIGSKFGFTVISSSDPAYLGPLEDSGHRDPGPRPLNSRYRMSLELPRI